MRAFMYRICITCVNIFFPPAAVIMLTGMGYDTMINCCLFLLAVIPSHVHGFYISCTYFHRRHKVKKGRYPGGPKSMIESSNVLNGGASDAEVDRLWRKENGVDLERKSSRRSSRSQTSRLDQGQEMRRVETSRSKVSKRGYSPAVQKTRTRDHVSRDGYEMPASAYAR